MRTTIAALSVALLIAAGCGYEPAAVPPAKQVASQQPAAKPGPASNTGISSPAEGQSGLTGGMRAAGNAIGMAPMDMMDGGSSGGAGAPPQKAKPASTYSKAQVGVGAQGQGYGGGMVTEPVRQYFRIRERINFLMMDKAMNDFKVLQERLPRDQQEFDKLMSENGVRFPQLNPGERYVYDPKTGELMVEHPGT